MVTYSHALNMDFLDGHKQTHGNKTIIRTLFPSALRLHKIVSLTFKNVSIYNSLTDCRALTNVVHYDGVLHQRRSIVH